MKTKLFLFIFFFSLFIPPAIFAQTDTPVPTSAGAKPTITNIQIVELTDKSAKVTWKTDINCTPLVSFGTSTSYGRTAQNSDQNTAFTLLLADDLTPSTQYHYQVSCLGGGDPNRRTDAPDATFTTNATSSPTNAPTPTPTSGPTPTPTPQTSNTPTPTPTPVSTVKISPTKAPTIAPTAEGSDTMTTTSADPQTLGASTSTAQTSDNYTLIFKVVNDKDNPLQGASINVYNGTNELDSLTDINGIATFKDIPSGSHLIKAQYKSQSLEQTINVTGDNKTISLTLRIKDSSTLIAFVTIIVLILAVLGGIYGWTYWKNKKPKVPRLASKNPQ